MSLYIKGLNMPNSGQVELVIRPHGKVFSKTLGIGKLEAVEIPTPHGRLIDIEKLKEEFAMKNNICKECDSFKKCDNITYSKSEICEKFIWVPTILEAEK